MTTNPHSTPAKPIFHLHIPKTGGQTFARRLAAGVAPGKALYQQDNITEFDRALLDKLAGKMAVISGHPEAGVLVDENRFAYAALIRDPVKQIVSNYLHVLRDLGNPFHETFQKLPVARAIDLWRPVFANFQSRSLVSSFNRYGPVETLRGEDRYLTTHLFGTTDRIDWLAPTAALDQLCLLMSVRTGHEFTRNRESVNIAQNPADPRGAELRAILLERPELYAIDTLLYEEAKRRVALLRNAIFGTWSRTGDPTGQAGTIYAADGQAIEVLEGWWEPFQETANWGLELRAGPSTTSRVRVRRHPGSRWLCFDIAFTAGSEPQELRFIDVRRGELLPFNVLQANGPATVAIDLQTTEPDCEIAMHVPRIYPLARFDGEWETSAILVSLSTGRWRLAEDLPEVTGAKARKRWWWTGLDSN